MDDVTTICKRLGSALRCLTTMAEQATEGIAVFDLTGSIRFANAAWARMHGYETSDDLVGKQIGLFHTPDQMKTAVIPFIKLTERRGCLEGVVEHVRSDGTAFSTEMKMTMVKGETGKPIGLVCYATDASKRKQDEGESARPRKQPEGKRTELTVANEQLRQQVVERERTVERLAEQTAKLTATIQGLQQDIAESKNSEQRLRQEVAELTTANRQLKDRIAELKQIELEMLEDLIDEEQPGKAIPVFDPQELEGLSQLAMRLA